jgi:hypothetical protein
MTKIGRNDPCPCGSGQKYKRCCLPRDEAAAVERARAHEREQAAATLIADDDDGLDEASNRAVRTDNLHFLARVVGTPTDNPHRP